MELFKRLGKSHCTTCQVSQKPPLETCRVGCLVQTPSWHVNDDRVFSAGRRPFEHRAETTNSTFEKHQSDRNHLSSMFKNRRHVPNQAKHAPPRFWKHPRGALTKGAGFSLHFTRPHRRSRPTHARSQVQTTSVAWHPRQRSPPETSKPHAPPDPKTAVVGRCSRSTGGPVRAGQRHRGCWARSVRGGVWRGTRGTLRTWYTRGPRARGV